MKTPLVSLENVSKNYKSLPALSSINLQLAQGGICEQKWAICQKMSCSTNN